ncbi:hypothetical protein O6P43_001628, partial [Quillaja saponaria]
KDSVKPSTRAKKSQKHLAVKKSLQMDSASILLNIPPTIDKPESLSLETIPLKEKVTHHLLKPPDPPEASCVVNLAVSTIGHIQDENSYGVEDSMCCVKSLEGISNDVPSF